jgi:hypothetical protein
MGSSGLRAVGRRSGSLDLITRRINSSRRAPPVCEVVHGSGSGVLGNCRLFAGMCRGYPRRRESPSPALRFIWIARAVAAGSAHCCAGFRPQATLGFDSCLPLITQLSERACKSRTTALDLFSWNLGRSSYFVMPTVILVQHCVQHPME